MSETPPPNGNGTRPGFRDLYEAMGKQREDYLDELRRVEARIIHEIEKNRDEFSERIERVDLRVAEEASRRQALEQNVDKLKVQFAKVAGGLAVIVFGLQFALLFIKQFVH